MKTAAKIVGVLAYLSLTAWLTYQVKQEQGYAGWAARKLGKVAIGDMAPNFTLEDMTGQRVSLSDFRGTVVLLDFWATWCPPCRVVMGALDSFYETHRKSGLVILAINQREKPESIRRKEGSREHTFRVLLDEDGRAGDAYGVEAIPVLVLVDRKGKIAWIKVGYDPNLETQLSEQLERLSGPSAKGRQDAGNLDRKSHQEVRR
jgi:peroxiredoxin